MGSLSQGLGSLGNSLQSLVGGNLGFLGDISKSLGSFGNGLEGSFNNLMNGTIGTAGATGTATGAAAGTTAAGTAGSSTGSTAAGGGINVMDWINWAMAAFNLYNLYQQLTMDTEQAAVAEDTTAVEGEDASLTAGVSDAIGDVGALTGATQGVNDQAQQLLRDSAAASTATNATTSTNGIVGAYNKIADLAGSGVNQILNGDSSRLSSLSSDELLNYGMGTSKSALDDINNRMEEAVAGAPRASASRTEIIDELRSRLSASTDWATTAGIDAQGTMQKAKMSVDTLAAEDAATSQRAANSLYENNMNTLRMQEQIAEDRTFGY